MKQSSMNPAFVQATIVFVVVFTLTHLLFAGLVRPWAESLLAVAGSESLGHPLVVLKDPEQQVCFSLALFCGYLMAYKLWHLWGEEALYTRDFLSDYAKSDSLELTEVIKKLEASVFRDSPAMATWIDCLRRYKNTRNVQHAADAIQSSIDTLAMQIESGNNMIRYIIWAIPSIGFIGTVRGIGQALSQADQALAGDISGMVASLGVAFNSTFVALLISIVLMLLLHLLNNRQDQMLLRTQETCEKHLLVRLHQ